MSETTTTSQSGLSDWAAPYVTDYLGKAQALGNSDYEVYQGPLTADANGTQQMAWNGIADLATRTPAHYTAANNAAQGALNGIAGLGPYTPGTFTAGYKAPDAFVGGGASSGYQAPGAYTGGDFSSAGFTPVSDYQNGTFTTGTFGTAEAQKYMNPYLMQALAPQLQEAERQANEQRMRDAGRLTQAGAYGGSRQAIMESEGNRNLAQQMANITGTGYAQAYDTAQRQFNTEQGLGLDAQKAGEQSRQFGYGQKVDQTKFGAQQALEAQRAAEQSRQFGYGQSADAAKTAAQLSLDAQRINAEDARFGAGLTADAAKTAATLGLDAQRMAENSRQFGATDDLNRLNAQLSGATTMNNLGTNQNATALTNLNALMGVGNDQRAIIGEGIKADHDEFLRQADYDYNQVNFMRDALTGLPVSSMSNTTPDPSMISQIAGIASVAKGLGAAKGGLLRHKMPKKKRKPAGVPGLAGLAISRMG